MKKLIIAIVIVLCTAPTFAKSSKFDIACQAYSYRDSTLEETLIALNKLGVRHIELFKKQKMSATDNREINFNMQESQLKEVKAMLKKYKIKPHSYGVISGYSTQQWEPIFKFAASLGVTTIVSEPQEQYLDLVDELCQKYKVKLAIHNHAKPKNYWNPQMAYDAVKGRSKYMGVCPDIGHWHRSGCDIVTGLRLLEGRLIEIHIKDVTKNDISGKTTILGDGVIDWDAVFMELRRQHFKGKLVMEHDTNWENPSPALMQNIRFIKTH